MKLVDVDLLKDIIYEMWGDDPAYHTAGVGKLKTETDARAEEACLILENIEALPPFEVVQCKDCKFYKQLDDACPFLGEDGFYKELPGENDFCSRGERKEEVDNG